MVFDGSGLNDAESCKQYAPEIEHAINEVDGKETVPIVKIKVMSRYYCLE
jgi:hypothetical protein